MNKKRELNAVQIRVIGADGEIDGYMEFFMGALIMSGLLHEMHRSKRKLDGGETAIYIEALLIPPPLGNLGDEDLPPYEGKQP